MREQHTKLAYSGNFVQVKESVIDGYVWEKAYFPDSLVVFPITKNGEIIMIEEKRPHEKKPSRLKFVTGHIHDGDDVLETANREMMEEVGLRANQLAEFLKHESSGTINSNFHFVIARDLEPNKIPNPDGEDTILAIHRMPFKKIEEMIYSEELPWSVSTLGMFKILHYLQAQRLDDLFT